MPFKMIVAPHLRGSNTTSKFMFNVILAMIPAILVATFFFGWGVLTNIIISCIAGVIVETIALKLRKHSLKKYLSDGSVLVTGTLLGIAIPQLAPWWLPVVGMIMAIGIAKHLYGGLGYNPFNPAAVGYVVMLISFPKEMSQWVAPDWMGQFDAGNLGIIDTLNAVFFREFPAEKSLDMLTGASPIDLIKGQLKMGIPFPEIFGATKDENRAVLGMFVGKGWEWVNVSLLIGGIYMIYKKVISWHIPAGMLGSLFILSGIFYLTSSKGGYMPPHYHIFSGGIMLGAFFIATDPVTTATSNLGKLIFGIGAGTITFLIRTWGSFPDGIAFAVLLMNLSAAYIDHFTVPKPYGYQKKAKGDK